MQPRTHSNTDRYATDREAVTLAAEQRARELELAQRRVEQHRRDLAAAYLGAERIAESERLAGGRR